MKVKKNILLDDDHSSMFNFELIGLSCHLKDYRLAWALNKALNFEFQKADGLEHKTSAGTSKHSVFSYETEENVIFTLIKNRTMGFLAKDVAHADYFIKIEGDYFQKELFLEQLKKVKGILAVFPLDVEQLKTKENFLF